MRDSVSWCSECDSIKEEKVMDRGRRDFTTDVAVLFGEKGQPAPKIGGKVLYCEGKADDV